MRAIILLILFGCQDRLEGEENLVENVENTAQKIEKGNSQSQSEPTRSAQKANPDDKAKTYNPLAGKSRLEVCKANGLSLIQWPYDERQSKHQELCCGEDGYPNGSMECELDWPVSDVLPCADYAQLLDTMRNEIFAYYGRAFVSAKWKAHFAQQPWYKVREDYSADWLNPIAEANVVALLKLKREQKSCISDEKEAPLPGASDMR